MEAQTIDKAKSRDVLQDNDILQEVERGLAAEKGNTGLIRPLELHPHLPHPYIRPLRPVRVSLDITGQVRHRHAVLGAGGLEMAQRAESGGWPQRPIRGQFGSHDRNNGRVLAIRRN